MKKPSLFLAVLLLGSIMAVFFLSTANCAWSTPIQLTTNTASDEFPSISGDGTKIAYSSNVDGDYEVFVVNSDGSGAPLQLTTNTASDGSSSISGDGTKIAYYSFDSGWDLFVINIDGTGLIQLTSTSDLNENYFPAISGDGSKIAYTSWGDGDAEIYFVNSDGTGLTQLTTNTVNDMCSSSISGDGTKIAYSSNVDGDYEVFVVNQDITPPTGSIIINNGDATTTSTSVTLTLTYSEPTLGVDKVRYTNAISWNDNTDLWEDPVASKSWTLESGDGEKHVSYQIRDNAGNIYQTYDYITLDTTPPTGSIIINNGDATTTSTSVTLTLTYSEPT